MKVMEGNLPQGGGGWQAPGTDEGYGRKPAEGYREKIVWDYL